MNLFSDASVPEGLIYRADFLESSQEAQLVGWIDDQPWLSELARRVQHYGWRYDYRARTIDARNRIGELPNALAHIAERLVRDGLLSEMPDQAIVNEYLPGQGIAQHIDCEPCFGDQVATVSLLDSYPMEFRSLASRAPFVLTLERRSACVLQGESRYGWTHGIARRLSDPVVGGGRRQRCRRVSVTFRRVVL